MEQNNVNLLTLSEYYMIMSSVTNRPYMDINYCCYMFEVKADAESFTKGLDKAAIKDKQHYKVLNLSSELYGSGFTTIKVKKKNADGFVEVPVVKEDAKKAYYNPECNRNLNRMRQTGKKSYLRALKDVPFIAPMYIETRMPAQYPGLFYSYALFKDDTQYYVLFTTLQEFEEWKSGQVYDWKPMELNLKKFGRIRGNSPVYINPLSDKLILDAKQINIVFAKKGKK